MAKCPKCSTRKAKRQCPALAAEICPSCCAEGRLQTIACPRDCVHLGGELYQHRRRQERAQTRGREFIEIQEKLFRDEGIRELAFRLQADIFYFFRENGSSDDASTAAALETLKSFLSKIFVPPEGSSPLGRFLVERMADARRYPEAPGFGTEERRRVAGILAGHIRSLARDGSRRYGEVLEGFFGELDFEADLDYSPRDAAAGAEGRGPQTPAGPAPRRTPGGLILPPGV